MTGDASKVKNLLLTGRPGVGKTTIVLRLADELADYRLAGFTTAEIRNHGQRVGFRATTLSGPSCVLAHIEIRSQQRVGRYGVDIPAFERLVLPELRKDCDIRLIDEIGKLECFSAAFVSEARRLLDDALPLVATVALKGGQFISAVKTRGDVVVTEATRGNRDSLPQQLAEQARALLRSQPR